MKSNRHYLFLIPLMMAGFFMMTSCESQVEEEVEEQTVPFTFTLKPFGLDGYFPMMEETRASSPATVNPTNLLILDVVDGKVKSKVEETGNKESLLKPRTIYLSFGSHDLYFLLCSTVYESVDESNLQVNWNAGTAKLNYVWALKKTVTSVQGQPEQYEETLPIQVAQVKLNCTDPANPDNVGNVVISSDGLCWTLDLKTMNGVAGEVSHSIDLSGFAKAPGKTLTTYTFVPSTGTIGKITYTAYDNTDSPQIIAKRDLTDIVVKKSYITSYSGLFFGTNSGLGMTLQDTWTDTIEKTFE